MLKLGQTLNTFLARMSLRRWIQPCTIAPLGFITLLSFITLGLTPISAQTVSNPNDPSNVFSKYSPGGGLNSGLMSGNGLGDRQPTSWTASYYSTDVDGTGVLEVEATLADSWHIYSMTQPPGGPTPTTITITSPDTVQTAGDFQPDYEPDRSESPVYKGVTIEEHSDGVLWTGTLQMPAGLQKDLTINVAGLVCKSGDGRCLPVKQVVTASYAGVYQGDFQPKASSAIASTGSAGSFKPEPFRDNRYYVQWKAEVTSIPSASSDDSAGQPQIAELQITATPDPSFHVYREATGKAEAATIFVVTEKSGLRIGQPQTEQVFKTEVLSPKVPPIHYYPGEVTWSLPIQITPDSEPGVKRIEGQIAYMACDDSSCREPKGLKFSTAINPDGSQAAPVKFQSVPFGDVFTLASRTSWVDDLSAPVQSVASETNVANNAAADAETAETDAEVQIQETAGGNSFAVVLLLAFIGGFVLNFMPCVLPVIGLKVMSFVGQGGEDRKRVFGLNLAYVGGICFVFAILAFLAIVFSFKWGEQFQYFSVRLGVTIGLFAFALSYFNVWEIPVPGMASGNKSQELQSKEGFAGAFSKGIFTTLLATPCSGPLLGGVFGATLGMTSPQIAAVFAMLALGMSSPYLAIGVNPGLVKFLPKPGPWMETFKQLMAFLFLAAVSYFFYQFADENKFPVFVTLMGVWFGCWIIGRVPNWDVLGKRIAAWVGGVGIATAIGVFAFTSLKAPPVLEWVDYDEASLVQYQAEGKTVLVDFSAKWCVNCLVNLETAIDTEATRRVVEKNGVVTMYADWTNANPEITAKLEELNSNSIPVLAIYPAGKPNQPIVLRDLVSQSTVIEALEQAGPSTPVKQIALR